MMRMRLFGWLWIGVVIGPSMCMELPLINSIVGFEADDEMLLMTREKLEDSRFQVCIGLKSGEREAYPFLSLPDSTFYYGMTPRLYCQSSRLVVFDKNLIKDNCCSVRLRAVRIEFPLQSVAIVHGTLASTYYSDRDEMEPFYGSSFETDPDKGSVEVYFDPAVPVAAAQDFALKFTGLTLSMAGVRMAGIRVGLERFRKQPKADLKVKWELRMVQSGYLLHTFTNRLVMGLALEWARPEDFWKLMLIRSGQWDKLLAKKVSFVSAEYAEQQHSDFHTVIMAHLDEAEKGNAKFLGYSMAHGLDHIQAIHFFRNHSKMMGLALMVLAEDHFGVIIPNSGDSPLIASLKTIHTAEVLLRGRLLFEEKFLNQQKATTNDLTCVKFIYERNGKNEYQTSIKSLQELIKISRSTQFKKYLFSPQDKFHLIGPCQSRDRFVSAMFDLKCLPQVLLQAYSLLLAHPKADWASSVYSISIRTSKGVVTSVPEQALRFIQISISYDSRLAPQNIDFRELLFSFMVTVDDISFIQVGEIKDGLWYYDLEGSSTTTKHFDKYYNQAASTVEIHSEEHDLRPKPKPTMYTEQMKPNFTIYSRNPWQSLMIPIGSPSSIITDLFIQHQFDGNQIKFGLFGFISQFVQNGGPFKYHCYRVDRGKVQYTWFILRAYIFGCPEVFGSPLLGAVFNFVPTADIVDNETYLALKLDPKVHCCLDLLVDPEADPIKLQNLLNFLDLASQKPVIPIFNNVQVDTWLGASELALNDSWQVRLSLDGMIHKSNFDSFYALQSALVWMDPGKLESVRLANLTHHHLKKFPAKIAVSVDRSRAAEFILRETSVPNLEFAKIFDGIAEIGFERIPDHEDRIRVVFSLPDASLIKQYKEHLARLLKKTQLITKFQASHSDAAMLCVMQDDLGMAMSRTDTLLDSMDGFLGRLMNEEKALLVGSSNDFCMKGKFCAIRATLPSSILPDVLLCTADLLIGMEGPWTEHLHYVHFKPFMVQDGKVHLWFWLWQLHPDTPEEAIASLVNVAASIATMFTGRKILLESGFYRFETDAFCSTKHWSQYDAPISVSELITCVPDIKEDDDEAHVQEEDLETGTDKILLECLEAAHLQPPPNYMPPVLEQIQLAAEIEKLKEDCATEGITLEITELAAAEEKILKEEIALEDVEPSPESGISEPAVITKPASTDNPSPNCILNSVNGPDFDSFISQVSDLNISVTIEQETFEGSKPSSNTGIDFDQFKQKCADIGVGVAKIHKYATSPKPNLEDSQLAPMNGELTEEESRLLLEGITELGLEAVMKIIANIKDAEQEVSEQKDHESIQTEALNSGLSDSECFAEKTVQIVANQTVNNQATALDSSHNITNIKENEAVGEAVQTEMTEYRNSDVSPLEEPAEQTVQLANKTVNNVASNPDSSHSQEFKDSAASVPVTKDLNFEEPTPIGDSIEGDLKEMSTNDDPRSPESVVAKEDLPPLTISKLTDDQPIARSTNVAIIGGDCFVHRGRVLAPKRSLLLASKTFK